MKKTIKGLLLGLILVFAVVLTSCDKCEHVAGASWRYSATEHWKNCEKCNSAVEKGKHEFGEWIIVQNPAVGVDGKQYRQCSVCRYLEEESIPAIIVETGVAAEDVAVYVKAPADWENANCYYWGDGIDSTKVTGWPGQAMTLVDETNNIYGFIIPAGTANVIFNNGAVQTADFAYGLTLNLYELTETNGEGKYLANYATHTPAADEPELNKYQISEAETFRTIYVQLPETWANHKVHFWGAGVGTTWPGDDLTVVDADKHVYSFELSSKVTGMLFDAKTDGDDAENPQTANVIPDEKVNGYIVTTDESGAIIVKTCTYQDGVFTEITLEPTELELFVRGSISGWDCKDEYKLTVDGDNATITITVAEGDEFKIADITWNSQIDFAKLVDTDAAAFADNGGNIKVLVAGTYVITVYNYNSDTRTATIVKAE